MLVDQNDEELISLIRVSLQTLIKNVEFDTFDEVKTLNLFKQYKSLHFVLISNMMHFLQQKNVNLLDWVGLKVR